MLLILFSISLCFSRVSPESHSLRYYYITMLGGAEFPEFIHVGILDDMQITYYDSVIQKDIPRQPWMNRTLGGDYWDQETKRLIDRQKLSLANVKIATRRTNSSNRGLNFLQYTSGCVLNDDGVVSGVRQYAFNGRDLISFNLEHAVWVSASPAALITKNKWNKNKADNQYKKYYTQETCVKWLKKYLGYSAQAMSRKVAPEVMVYARKSQGGQKLSLVCLVTGFYPPRINVTWIKEGLPLAEAASSGILPNHDSTYQIKKSFQTELGDRRDYVCHVEHSSFSEARSTAWDKTCDGDGLDPWLISIIVLLILLVGIAVCLVYKWREVFKRVCHLKGEPEKNKSPSASTENSQSSLTHPNQDISEQCGLSTGLISDPPQTRITVSSVDQALV